MLHETLSRSAQAWSVFIEITPATQTFYACKGRATPGNLHPQSSTTVTHCLIGTHFTDTQKDDTPCQARKCHRELNWSRWRQRQVCYLHYTVIVASTGRAESSAY